MGKSHTSSGKLQQLARIISVHKGKPKKSVPTLPMKPRKVKIESQAPQLKKLEDKSGSLDGQKRVPLSQVVSGCSKRWFQDTLKEAQAGDTSMQILVAQMYFHSYGVPQDIREGLAWFRRASKDYAVPWKMSDKHPGYNTSDPD